MNGTKMSLTKNFMEIVAKRQRTDSPRRVLSIAYIERNPSIPEKGRKAVDYSTDCECQITGGQSCHHSALISYPREYLSVDRAIKFLPFREASDRKALVQFEAHHHTERNDQCLENQIVWAMNGSAGVSTFVGLDEHSQDVDSNSTIGSPKDRIGIGRPR